MESARNVTIEADYAGCDVRGLAAINGIPSDETHQDVSGFPAPRGN